MPGDFGINMRAALEGMVQAFQHHAGSTLAKNEPFPGCIKRPGGFFGCIVIAGRQGAHGAETANRIIFDNGFNTASDDQPSWSPEGNKLVFISPCKVRQDLYRGSGMYLINYDGSGLQPLYDESWGLDNVIVTTDSLYNSLSSTSSTVQRDSSFFEPDPSARASETTSKIELYRLTKIENYIDLAIDELVNTLLFPKQ